MPTSVWVITLVVLGAVLEADLGYRKISWFRVLRPLVAAVAIVPLYLAVVPTSGNNLALQGTGVAVGVIGGLACHLFISVHFDPAKGKRGRPVSRAGLGYALFWVVVFGARLAFIYGSYHLFSRPLGQFLVAHQLSIAGLTDALIFMALAMALSRSALLGWRGLAVRHDQPVRPLRTA